MIKSWVGNFRVGPLGRREKVMERLWTEVNR